MSLHSQEDGLGGTPQDSKIWKKATEWLYQLQLKKDPSRSHPSAKKDVSGNHDATSPFNIRSFN